MSFEIRVFQIPKLGSEPDECEDALSFDPQGRLFAIADGATDSAFQRLWAGLLVKGFISHPPDFFRPSNVKEWFGGWLKAQQEQWGKNIPWDSLSWSGHNKAKMQGGEATFLGIYFFPDKSVWKGIAFGDCNFFHFLNGGHLYDWKPLIHSEEFGSSPVALSSINPNVEIMLGHMMEIGGDYHQGDIILLATDALAEWLVKEIWLVKEGDAEKKSPWDTLFSLKTPDDFETLISELRRDKKIKNDDTSLIIIEITHAPDKANIKQN